MIKSIIIPLMTPIPYTINSIFKLSLILLLVLNNTNIATPLPDSNPAIVAPNVITLFIYNSVISTDAPQLGIKPIIQVINGENILFFNKILDSSSSPP